MTLLKTLLLPFLLLAAGIAPGWLGVFLGEADDGRASVTEVVAGSPAEKAGILAGDVLLAIDGQDLTTQEAVVAAVGAKEAGSTVKVTVRRDGANKVLEVKLGTRPADPEAARAQAEEEAAARQRAAAAQAAQAAEGARREAEKAAKAAEIAKAAAAKQAVAKAAAEKAEKGKEARAKEKEAEKEHTAKAEGREKPHAGGRPFLGVALDATDAGVRIGEVLAGSPAATAGLTAGAVIVAIGDAEIKTLADIDAAMGKLRVGQKVGIRVRADGGKAQTVAVVLGTAPGEDSREHEARAEASAKPEARRVVDPARAVATPRVAATDRAATEAAVRPDVKEALRAARGRQPALLVFGASWDSGTKALERTLVDEKVRKALQGVAIVWVDTDREGRIADEFGVQQIPHMVALDAQGKKLATLEGYQPPEVLLEKIEALRTAVRTAKVAPDTTGAPEAKAKAKADAKPDPKPDAKPQARTKAEPKPTTDKPAPKKPPTEAGERDLEAEVRALRDEIRELRQLLRELLKDKEKRG